MEIIKTFIVADRSTTWRESGRCGGKTNMVEVECAPALRKAHILSNGEAVIERGGGLERISQKEFQDALDRFEKTPRRPAP